MSKKVKKNKLPKSEIELRLPRSLHRQASLMASRDGVSLNDYLLAAIAARVGALSAYAEVSAEEGRP